MSDAEFECIELHAIGYKPDDAQNRGASGEQHYTDSGKDGMNPFTINLNTPPNNSTKSQSWSESFLGQLKWLETTLLGTEEERAQRRADKERKKEEDRKRWELEKQEREEKLEQYARECALRLCKGLMPLSPKTLDHFQTFMVYAARYDEQQQFNRAIRGY